MITNFINWLFGCRHRRLTWPIGRREKCHVTCLRCGVEFGYSWREMKIVRPQGGINTAATEARGQV